MTTTEKLNAILDAANLDAETREELYLSFNLQNPLELAKRLHRHEEVPDRVKSEILSLRVSLPPRYQIEGFDVVVREAVDRWWAELFAARAVEQ